MKSWRSPALRPVTALSQRFEIGQIKQAYSLCRDRLRFLHRKEANREVGDLRKLPLCSTTEPHWSMTRMALNALAKKFAKAAVPARMRFVGALSHLNRVRGASR